jgi:hypothetical protein
MGVKYRYDLSLSEPWSVVSPWFSVHPEGIDKLLEHVTERDGSVVFETLTVKSMLEVAGGGVPSELSSKIASCTVRGFASMLNSLRDGLSRFVDFLESTKPPVTAYSEKMSVGTLKGNIEEAILWTLRQAYGLQSLEQAHSLTVYEYMVARKSVYNDAVVAYNKEMDIISRNAATAGR